MKQGIRCQKRTERVGRTLLSAAFDVALAVAVAFVRMPKIKANHKVKIGGQECPPYTRIDPTNGNRNSLT
jgi:hypothetical protein